MASHFRFKKQKDITSSLVDYTLTHTNKLNDFTEGSALQTLYEAISTELEMYYYLGVENLKTGIWNGISESFGFPRRPMLKAYGTIVVEFSDVIASTVRIPKGLKVSSSDDYYSQVFETLDEYVIDPGTLTTEITVYCTQGGTYGNVPAGTLDTISNLSAVASVTNPEAIQTGKDEESLIEVRTKFRQFIQALQRGTVQAIQFGAKNVPNVDGAYVEETPGYVKLYVHDANGDLPERLKLSVQNELYYWRSVGVPVEVFGVHKTLIDLDVTLDVPNPSLQTDLLLSAVGDKLTKYLNAKQVNDDLYINDLVQQIMDVNDLGIADVQVNAMAYPDSSMRGTQTVSDLTSIVLNEHKYPRSMFVPSDRSIDENYIVSNPEDQDPNEYAPIDDDDTQIAETTKNPYTTSTSTSTTLSPEEEAAIGHGNTLIYPRLTDFALTDTNPWWDDPTVGGDPLDNENPRPFAVGQIGTLKYFDYALNDGSTMGVLLDSDLKVLMGIRLRFADGTRYNITLDDDIQQATVDYYTKDATTATESKLIALSSDVTFQGAEFYFTADQLYIRDNTTDAKYTFTRKTVTFKEAPVDDQTTSIEWTGGASGLFNVTHLVQGNLSIQRGFNAKGVLKSTKVTYLADNGNTTVVSYDENGNTLQTDVTDASGKLISSSDGNGISLLTTTTTLKPGETTTSTSTTSTSSTTTTTTAYPFFSFNAVSAAEAPGEGYLPVYGHYETSGNELIKAGAINLAFKEN